MIMRYKKLIIFFSLIFLLIVVVGVLAVNAVMKMGEESRIPNYELGEHRGAKFCATCHRAIYNQWRDNSPHAISTTGEGFLVWKEKLENHYVLNKTFGMGMCHACQGPLEYGVDCETCHGVIPPKMEIMKAHRIKFKPAREENLSKPDFCPKCHGFPEGGMTNYVEWQKSEAAEKGQTCQTCHMKKDERGVPYHGFDGIVRSHDVEMYKDDLEIHDIRYSFPDFSLAVENKVTAHAIPAVGPSRLLVLEISFQNANGVEVHKITEGFAKYMSLIPLIGLFPNKVEKNTQLQSQEVRPLRYTLPPELEGQLEKAVVTLRIYDVYDFYEGNLEKAHLVSEPIIEKEVQL
jgi:hypothetical protein